MKINQKFVHRKIAGENLLIPVGKSSNLFNGIMTMNDMGVFIWENLKEVESEDEMLQKILSEYEIDENTAKQDLDEFLGKLRQVDII